MSLQTVILHYISIDICTRGFTKYMKHKSSHSTHDTIGYNNSEEREYISKRANILLCRTMATNYIISTAPIQVSLANNAKSMLITSNIRFKLLTDAIVADTIVIKYIKIYDGN